MCEDVCLLSSSAVTSTEFVPRRKLACQHLGKSPKFVHAPTRETEVPAERLCGTSRRLCLRRLQDAVTCPARCNCPPPSERHFRGKDLLLLAASPALVCNGYMNCLLAVDLQAQEAGPCLQRDFQRHTQHSLAIAPPGLLQSLRLGGSTPCQHMVM